MKNLDSFGQIDALLNEVEQATNVDLGAIDSLCDEIDGALDARKTEVTEWPKDKKRQEAVELGDTYALNLLSMDEDFNVRILAMCNPDVPTNSMKRLVESGNDYTRLVIANNPSATSDILDRIAELTDEREVLNAVKLHPNASSVTKYRIENRL